MFIAALLALGLTATDVPPTSTPPLPGPSAPTAIDAVLVMDLRATDVPASQARLIDGFVARAVAKQLARLPGDERPAIHTMEEFRTLADVEAQRLVGGCDEGSASCLAEVAGALGARYVVSGSLGVLGTDVVLQLNLLDTRAGRTLSRGSVSRGDIGALQGAIDGVVAEVLAPLTGEAPSTASTVSTASTPWGLIAGGTTAAVGVAAAGAGFGGLALFETRLGPSSSASATEKEQALQLAWPALWVGVGGAALAVTGVAVAVAVPGGE